MYFCRHTTKQRMHFRRLIFIMLAAISLLLPIRISAAVGIDAHIIESIGRTNDRPQWDDLGMKNIMAVNGQSNITPPSPVRLACQGRRSAGGNSHSTGIESALAMRMVRHCCYERDVCGISCIAGAGTREYLYLIRCLRL